MSRIVKYLSYRALAQTRAGCCPLAGNVGQVRWASDHAGSSSFLPRWVKSRLPSALGGDRESLKELENLTMDSYLQQITAARKLGSISGSAFGAKASDAGTQGFLRNTELVIGALTEEEKKVEELAAVRVDAIARELNLSREQVAAVIGRYKYTKHMMAVLAQRKREGKEMPQTIEEVEQLTGNWRSYVAQSGGGMGLQRSPGSLAVPPGAMHPKGGPCGLAGLTVGRSTKCPRFRKSYKACCGKGR